MRASRRIGEAEDEMRKLLHVIVPLLALVACTDDIRPDDSGDDEPEPETHVTHTDHGDGTRTTQVDATRMDAWVYLDLDSTEEVAETDARWDLAFQRFKIRIDGGVSGGGGMELAVLPGADFAAAAAPTRGYFTDEADGADDDSDPDLAFLRGDGWYSYDVATHVVTPRDQIYVVGSTEGRYYKLRLTDYYDSAGTSGFPMFDWGPITSPELSDMIVVEATDAQVWVHVDVERGVLAVADPAMSSEWDLAVSRTRVRTNGGTSGGGVGGALLAPDGATYDSVTSAPADGYVADAMIPIPGPPGSGEYSGNPVLADWFNYDATTHAVSSKQLTYLVRTATGSYAKLQVASYASGVITLRFAPVARQ
jgi:hypothetical protein